MPVRLEPLTKAHVSLWNGLLAEIERVEQSGEHYNEADLLEEMANPDIEVGKDMIGAFEGDDLIGYFTVYPRSVSDAQHKIDLAGAVRPDRRGEGIGTMLTQAMMARAEEAHADKHPDLGAVYAAGGPSEDESQADLMSTFGLRAERWSFVMRADLAKIPDPEPMRDGLEIRAYDESMARLLLETHNIVFLDHPNFSPWTDVMWKQWVSDSRNFRPQHSFVVVDPTSPDQLAAYVQTNEYDAYFQATGRREAYVAKVGTRRKHRGKGLASGLLQHCLVAYRDAGFDEASLDVDSENPTGALGVYRRAGFGIESKLTDYVRRT